MSGFGLFSYFCSHSFLFYLFALTRFSLWPFSISNNFVFSEEENNYVKDLFSYEVFQPVVVRHQRNPLGESAPDHFTRTHELLSAQPGYQQCPDERPQPHHTSHGLVTPFSRNPKQQAKSSGDNSSQLLTSPFPMGAQPLHSHMASLHSRRAEGGPNIPRRQTSLWTPQIA